MKHLNLLMIFILSLYSVLGNADSLALVSEEMRFLNLINQYRQHHNLPTLSLSPQLEASSAWMSKDMATQDYVEHTDSQRRGPFTRMAQFGYTFQTHKGENILAGVKFDTAEAAFEGWRTACDEDENGKCTYAHNENMLDHHFHVIGISRSYGELAEYNWFWVTDFGGK